MCRFRAWLSKKLWHLSCYFEDLARKFDRYSDLVDPVEYPKGCLGYDAVLAAAADLHKKIAEQVNNTHPFFENHKKHIKLHEKMKACIKLEREQNGAG